LCAPAYASEALDQAHKLEESLYSTAAGEAFTKAVKMTPADAELLAGYAEFLERYHDASARAIYRRADDGAAGFLIEVRNGFCPIKSPILSRWISKDLDGTTK